ncbi:hypothetical protein AJR20_022325, partial [Shigella dysenteriae]
SVFFFFSFFFFLFLILFYKGKECPLNSGYLRQSCSPKYHGIDTGDYAVQVRHVMSCQRGVDRKNGEDAKS